MALPTVTDLKLVLRIQTTADDTLLTSLLARALGMVEGALGRPITKVSTTWKDYGDQGRFGGALTRLVVPVVPYDTLAIVDADGVALSSSVDYYAPGVWDATVRARPGMTFPVAPYTLTANVGLSAAANYATVIEPAVSAAILDVAADLYQRRSAAATAESENGIAVSYGGGVPQRVVDMLAPWIATRV